MLGRACQSCTTTLQRAWGPSGRVGLRGGPHATGPSGPQALGLGLLRCQPCRSGLATPVAKVIVGRGGPLRASALRGRSDRSGYPGPTADEGPARQNEIEETLRKLWKLVIFSGVLQQRFGSGGARGPCGRR